ncbi:processed cyclic AMP-responsive element-binding protein 3-like protein [Tanacetum coccineum]
MMLLNISRAWESADTSTSTALVNNLPVLFSSLTSNNKSGKTLGTRLTSAGRRFQSMGQYGQGELQRISKAMISTGKLLSATPVVDETGRGSKEETRMFKFGELQIELTREKAYIGAAIGFVYAIISWELSQGIQNVPESTFQYANDNALMIAKSLRGTILVLFYGSTVLSGFATLGLLLLSRELKSGNK